MRVTLTGWTDNGNCDKCDEIMGSFTCAEDFGTTACTYNYSNGSGSPCAGLGIYGEIDISILIEDSSGNTKVTITVTYRPGDHWIKYIKTFSGAQDCTAFSDEPIPYDSHYKNGFYDDCDYEDVHGDIDDCLLTSL